MLCCISKRYFAAPLRASGTNPLLWTTGLMAPESYILKAAIDGWLAGESGEQIRTRAAPLTINTNVAGWAPREIYLPPVGDFPPAKDGH